MATPYSGLVEFPFWWLHPATGIGAPPSGSGSPFLMTFTKEIRCQMRSANESDVWVFSPLFLTAIGFAVTLRLLEVYLSVTTDLTGLATMWRGAAIGDLGIADFACLVACAFVIVAILDVLQSPKMIGRWIALGFCVLLAVYAAGIYRFTETMIDLGFPVESWLDFSEE